MNEVDAAVEVEFILVAEDVTFDGVDIIVVVVKDTKMEDVDIAEKDGLMLVVVMVELVSVVLIVVVIIKCL